MSPEERLNGIVEEQRTLRERLAQLDAAIAAARAEFKASSIPSAPLASKPAPVSHSVSAPPPLPGAGSRVPETAKPPTPLSSAAAEIKSAPPAAPVTRPHPPPVSSPTSAPVKGDFEMQLGKVWFVRIGIVAILTGLALGSVYAYKNFIHAVPVFVKVLALYGISGALAGLGIWLERSRESLKTFGRVITAGGMAAVYYTTYAMHHVPRLQLVESPLTGGLLLLVCALAIFFYADRRKDQTVASMAMVLGYYGTCINPVGWFSLFSNLVLSAGGLWLLWRHRWVALGALSVVGAYGGFGFWQYALPLITTGKLAPMDYWAGQGFLLGCWVMFTAAFIFAGVDVLKVHFRATLVSLNNGGFGTLFTIALLAETPMAERVDAFFHFTLVWAAVLFVLAWIVERLHKEHGRALSETFLAFGVVTFGLGMVVKFTGYERATAFAFQTALLAWLGARQKRWVASIGAVLTGLFVVQLALAHYFFDREVISGFAADVFHPSLQAILLLIGGWFLRGSHEASGAANASAPSGSEVQISQRPLSWMSLVLCSAAFLVWMLSSLLPLDAWWKPTVLLLICGLLGVLGRVKQIDLHELTFTARIAGLFSAVVIAVFAVSGKTPESLGVEILGAVLNILLLAAGAWFARHRPVFGRTQESESLSWTAVLYSVAAIISFIFITRLPFDGDLKPAIWVALCALLVVGGKLAKVPELSLVSALATLWMSWIQLSSMHIESMRIAALFLMLAFALLTVAAWWPAGGWSGWGVWAGRLRWLAALQMTISYLHWWHAHEPAYFSLATAVPAFFLAGLSRWKGDALSARWAILLSALALARFGYDVMDLSLFASSTRELIKMPWWAGLTPLLVMAAEILMRNSAVFQREIYKVWINFLAVAAVVCLWLYLTFEVLESGHYRTMAWAGLALLLFVIGIVLHHKVDRRAGLAILALALGRIVFYDVWQLETAARFASFLVIGGVLVALGFFYNRFEDFIRKYL